MAYQPIPRPVTGHISVISTHAQPVSLAVAGVQYVIMALKLLPGLPNPYTIVTERVSIMATNRKTFEWEFLSNPDVVGDPLVFEQLDPLSVLQGAIGNGTQIATGGFQNAVGGYVPPEDERSAISPVVNTGDRLVAVPESLIGYVVATPLANNAAVVSRVALQEILLEGGTPQEPAESASPAPPADIVVPSSL